MPNKGRRPGLLSPRFRARPWLVLLGISLLLGFASLITIVLTLAGYPVTNLIGPGKVADSAPLHQLLLWLAPSQ